MTILSARRTKLRMAAALMAMLYIALGFIYFPRVSGLMVFERIFVIGSLLPTAAKYFFLKTPEILSLRSGNFGLKQRQRRYSILSGTFPYLSLVDLSKVSVTPVLALLAMLFL